ncbi:hypothetical protein C8Q76DRAFT_117197 [Earliella scabrosa]|nr:hypothetical protein C8Q76DRAFT_117197 [Earliella scabrosa]
MTSWNSSLSSAVGRAIVCACHRRHLSPWLPTAFGPSGSLRPLASLQVILAVGYVTMGDLAVLVKGFVAMDAASCAHPCIRWSGMPHAQRSLLDVSLA